MQSRFRKGVLEILAACLASAAAVSAHGADFTFDFVSAPDACGGIDLCSSPTFNQGAFTLTSVTGTGFVVWDSQSPGHLTVAGSPSAVSATMNFSQPVSSIDLDAANNSSSDAVLTPILVGGADGSPVRSVPYSDGVYGPISTITGGPYIGLRVEAASPYSFTWTNLKVSTSTAYPPDATSIRNVPTPAGSNVPVITLDMFKSTSTEVVIAGTTEADFCVARDLRETTVNNKAVYIPRPLRLSEVAGTGSCKGAIPPTQVGVSGVTTWEALLAVTDLQVPLWYRSFKGTFQGITGYWFMIGIVRSSAEHQGPVGVLPYPEKLISFPAASLQSNGELKCNTTLDQRPLALGGTVAAFNDFMNVEGNRMIMDTVQCDGTLSATRRTVHATPMKVDGKLLGEVANIATQLDGLGRTLTEAKACLLPVYRPAITAMQSKLSAALQSITRARWDLAIADLEEIARLAKAASFSSCGTEPYSNYKGGIMSRAESAAFTVWDRFKFRTGIWQQYVIPTDLELPLANPVKP